MDNIFANMFRLRQGREQVPGVIKTPDPNDASNKDTTQGGSFEERIERPRSEAAALTISGVYRAVELRAKTEAQFLMQYQRLNREGGNFVPDMYGPGRRLNYLLQVQPNPISTAASLFEGIVINRLQKGNAFVYVERDDWGDPSALWLAQCGGYNQLSGRYTLSYLGAYGEVIRFEAPREDVLHFPNTFRTADGFWGISTLQYAIDTLSHIKTLKRQSLETAAKGGRVKLIIGEEKPAQGAGTLAFGLMAKDQMDKYAEEINSKIYEQDVVAIRGLDKVQNISMSATEMQMVEQLGMSLDDVARFWATPRPLLMLDTNSHYTTPTNATLEYMTRTVQPDIMEVEQEFQRKLLTVDDFGKRRFHMCEQPLLRLDKEAQAKVDKLRIESGSATVNEVRKQYDMPAVDMGDTVYVSTNLAELGSPKLSGLQPQNTPNNEPPKTEE